MSAVKRQRHRPVCPEIGALMRYGVRVVRVVAESSGQRVIVESVNGDGRLNGPTSKPLPPSGSDRDG